MRNDILEQAKAIRGSMNKVTSNLTDEQAIEVKELYPLWSGDRVDVYDGTDGEHSQTKVRGKVDNNLYKCNISHTTQENWPPETTPNLWTQVAEDGEYREIKDNMLPTEAFAFDEIGWYQMKDNLYKSKLHNNVYTPVTYPDGWEKAN